MTDDGFNIGVLYAGDRAPYADARPAAPPRTRGRPRSGVRSYERPPRHRPPRTALEELMAQALAMEREAVERYTELADVMETHNNREVAALFRTHGRTTRRKHAEQIMAQMGWTQPPAPPRAAWPD